MTLITVDKFGGLAPILDPRKLPSHSATVARDGKFDGNDFRPLREHRPEGTSYGFPVAALYKYVYKDESRWLAWPGPWVVDVVRSPIPQDENGRVYWTRVKPGTEFDETADNRPRLAVQPSQMAIEQDSTSVVRKLGVPAQPSQMAIEQDSTSVVRKLGVPAPSEAPAAVEQQKDYSVSTMHDPPQITNMAPTSPITVTAPGHPFEDGWTVRVTDPIEMEAAVSGTVVNVTNVAPPGTTDPEIPPGGDPGGDPGDAGDAPVEVDVRGMARLLGKEFIVGEVAEDTFVLRGADGSTANPFVPGETDIEIERVYEDEDMETRSYVYTFVTDLGEEGPPSPPLDPIDVRYDSDIEVTCSDDGGGDYGLFIGRVRVYRSAAGFKSAGYFYVGEVPFDLGAGTVVLVDDKEPIQLGELLPSTTWMPPPNGLKGLRVMPNGFLVGFKGNTVYLSEPYLPHAWPVAYRKTTEDDIVGIEVYGQTMVIATQGKPYLAAGSDPASFTLAELDVHAPCLSKGGVCSIGVGVVYPTPDGLVLVSGAGAEVLTVNYVGKREWAAMWSVTMRAVFYDRRYIALSEDRAKPTLIVENRPGELAISTAGDIGTAPYIDPANDELQFIESASRSTRHVWEGAALYQDGVWQSKVWTLPHAVNLPIGQVFADDYPVTLTFRYADLQASGQPLGEVTDSFTLTVDGPEPFRLPGGFLSREWQVEVSTKYAVQGINITDNMDQIR